jgi:hypothetical protein
MNNLLKLVFIQNSIQLKYPIINNRIMRSIRVYIVIEIKVKVNTNSTQTQCLYCYRIGANH